MQFEGSRRSSHVPNLTPLIDIVFLLLIFFMLTSHFVREDTLSIQLPEANTSQQSDKEAIEIIIDAQGKWLYKNEILNADALSQVLHEDLLQRTDKQVRIRGDKSSNLASTVKLLDIAREAGATGVEIVTEKK